MNTQLRFRSTKFEADLTINVAVFLLIGNGKHGLHQYSHVVLITRAVMAKTDRKIQYRDGTGNENAHVKTLILLIVDRAEINIFSHGGILYTCVCERFHYRIQWGTLCK